MYIYLSIHNYKQLLQDSLAIGHAVFLILGTETPKAGMLPIAQNCLSKIHEYRYMPK